VDHIYSLFEFIVYVLHMMQLSAQEYDWSEFVRLLKDER